MAQAGLEDWELSKIRVNLLQRADASDLLERLSMLQPLPSLQQSIDRRKLQGLFTRSSAQKAGMQRRVSPLPFTSCHCLCIDRSRSTNLPGAGMQLTEPQVHQPRVG